MAEPTREELLAEAYKRGILPPEMKTAYEEAGRRGLVKIPSIDNQQPAVSEEAPQQPQPLRMAPELPPLNLMPSHGGELAPAHGRPENFFNKLAGVRESMLGPNSGVSAKDIAPYQRMMLEGGGAAGGAALGLIAGPAGGVVGGGLGYSAGKTLADLIDESTGVGRQRTGLDKYLDPVGEFMTPGSTVERVTRPIRDTAAGIGMGAAGEALAQGVVATVDAGRGVIRWIKAPTSISQKTAGKQAGEYLVASTSDGPIYAKNAAEAQKIEEIINTGAKEGDPLFKFTLGERSFDPNQIKAQQVVDLPQGKGATLRAEHYDSNDRALRSYFQRNFSGEEGISEFKGALTNRKDMLTKAQQGAQERVEVAKQGIPTDTPDQAGIAALDAIEAAKKPVRRTMNELEKAIPDYPMEFNNLKIEMDLIKRDPSLNIDQRRAIEAFEKNDLPDLLKNGSTTQAARGINRTLGDRSAELKRAGKKDIAFIYERLRKSGLQPDIDAISDMARTGKVVEWNGKAVNADQIADALEKDMRHLAEIKAETSVDLDAIKKGIQDAGGRVFMQQVHEGNNQYIQRLMKDYKNLTGNSEAPIKSSTNQQTVKLLEDRIAQNRQILSEISPGQDVGAAMSAYNRYASQEWFGRFDKGAIKDVTSKGNQATGTRLRIEQIPARFKTPQGADDLITAVGPEKAQELMRGNLGYDMLQNTTDANGNIVANRLTAWQNKNKMILEKYGMVDDFKDLKSAQAVADKTKEAATEFEKSSAGKLIGIDSDKVVKNIVEGNKTAAEMEQVVQVVKSDPAALKGLKNSFGQWVIDNASTTWKALSENQATISMAQFSKSMKKAMEAARVLYRDEPQKLQALQTMQRAYEITFRSSRAPAGVGSPTAEKMANLVAKNTMNMVADFVPGSAPVKAARSFWNFMGRMRQNNVDEIIAQAIYDPDYAYMLIRGSKGQLGDIEAIKREVNGKIIRLDEYRKQSQAMLAGSAAAQQGRGE